MRSSPVPLLCPRADAAAAVVVAVAAAVAVVVRLRVAMAATPPATAPAAPPAPTPIDIKDGKVSGADVTFSIERPGRGGGAPTTVKYSLKIDGDTMKGTSSFDGPNGAISQDITATRSKE